MSWSSNQMRLMMLPGNPWLWQNGPDAMVDTLSLDTLHDCLTNLLRMAATSYSAGFLWLYYFRNQHESLWKGKSTKILVDSELDSVTDPWGKDHEGILLAVLSESTLSLLFTDRHRESKYHNSYSLNHQEEEWSFKIKKPHTWKQLRLASLPDTVCCNPAESNCFLPRQVE